ncbi:MAG: WG repeat-containing protein [Treponema sp.]|jgi:hypothetical protein|nr:WG repeat-containing protein [Treponema sp.]
MKDVLGMAGIFFIFIGISAGAEEYKQLFLFHEGLAVAQTTSEEWVVINTQGEIVLSLSKLNLGGSLFSEGLMAVRTSSGKYGFIDITGKMVIQPHYSYAQPFSEGLAVVLVPSTGHDTKSKYGYVRKNGEVAIPLQYDNATSFHSGRAFVYRESGWFLIDQSGMFVTTQAFETVREFSEGLAAVRVNKRWGYINRDGVWKIPPCFTAAFPFSDGLAGVSRMGSSGWDFIDREGNVVFERVVDTIQFESTLYFQEGWAVIPKGNKYWYLSTDGRTLPAIYDRATDFSKGVAAVTIDGKAGIIDQTGNWVVPPGEFDGLGYFWEGRALAGKDGKTGYINAKGEWLF